MDKTKDLEEGAFLPRRPLKEDIFDYLHNRIISGKYPPGEWLRQEDISSLLRVSQTPVREALDLLVSAGLAERVPYRGVRVLHLTPDEMIDSYGMRLIIESLAAYESACKAAAWQTAEMSRIVEQTRTMNSLDDMSRLWGLNRQFHLSIVEAAGNHLLDKLYRMVLYSFPDWMLYESMFRHPELLEPDLRREYEEHKGIVDAIAAGDAQAAAGRTLAHIVHLGVEFEAFLGLPGEQIRAKETQIAALTQLNYRV